MDEIVRRISRFEARIHENIKRKYSDDICYALSKHITRELYTMDSLRKLPIYNNDIYALSLTPIYFIPIVCRAIKLRPSDLRQTYYFNEDIWNATYAYLMKQRTALFRNPSYPHHLLREKAVYVCNAAIRVDNAPLVMSIYNLYPSYTTFAMIALGILSYASINTYNALCEKDSEALHLYLIFDPFAIDYEKLIHACTTKNNQLIMSILDNGMHIPSFYKFTRALIIMSIKHDNFGLFTYILNNFSDLLEYNIILKQAMKHNRTFIKMIIWEHIISDQHANMEPIFKVIAEHGDLTLFKRMAEESYYPPHSVILQMYHSISLTNIHNISHLNKLVKTHYGY